MYDLLLDVIVQRSKHILKDNLTGIYLHGSAAMDCFNPGKSDLDLIVVAENHLSKEVKRNYLYMIMSLNPQAPAKGIELSIVMKEVCRVFEYPTPYGLHFSAAHRKDYQADPEGYIEKMQGTDRDLAAHFMMIYHRGRTLYGKEIKEVFAEVDRDCYFDSIMYDVEDAAEQIVTDPVYIILNLCRVLAYKRDSRILSKKEGGEWGLAYLPEKYRGMVSSALEAYQGTGRMVPDKGLAAGFVEYMLGQVRA